MTQLRATSDSHSPADRTAAVAVAVGVVLLVFIGFAASYATLRDLAVSAGRFSPWLAPVVPLSFDLGIVVLSLKVVLAAKDGRSAIWLRLMVSGLSAATVAANANAAPTVVGRLLHTVPPAMFVICFESVTGSARRNALQARNANVKLPTVRPMLLLLAPVTSYRRWRRQGATSTPVGRALRARTSFGANGSAVGRSCDCARTDRSTAGVTPAPIDRWPCWS